MCGLPVVSEEHTHTAPNEPTEPTAAPGEEELEAAAGEATHGLAPAGGFRTRWRAVQWLCVEAGVDAVCW